MAISNCLFSPTFEIPQEFQTWFVPAWRQAGATTQCRDSWQQALFKL
jgi:hypothetical protein